MDYRYVMGRDGMIRYVTSEGDSVDNIAYGYYGNQTGRTEAIYAINPGLAAKGPMLPVGIVVVLPPDTGEPVSTPVVSLWD